MAATRLTARSARPAIESEIERLIGLLDARDPDADLEDNGDLEPSIGMFNGQVDLEEDTSDREPSLGSLDHIDQRRWRGPDCVNAGLDLELQTYASAPRRLGLQSWELVRRERAETDRVSQQLGAVVSRLRRREQASRRAAR